MAAPKTRLRKVSCPDCGYTVRMARSWMVTGLPTCPCGQSMRPDAPADLALCGLIGRPIDDFCLLCAACGSPMEIISGREMQVEYLELAEAEQSAIVTGDE